MKYSMILMSVFTTMLIVNCSTIPEIKPYEASEAKEEAAADELPYGQSISDSVFSDTTVAADDDVPTEFDDSIDSAGEDSAPEMAEAPAPKKEIVAKKIVAKKDSQHNRTPSSIGKGKNGFYTFSADCVMKAEPNDASAAKGNVSAGKKLWLDSHDVTWFKAYKKNETVYVPSSCVQ